MAFNHKNLCHKNSNIHKSGYQCLCDDYTFYVHRTIFLQHCSNLTEISPSTDCPFFTTVTFTKIQRKWKSRLDGIWAAYIAKGKQFHNSTMLSWLVFNLPRLQAIYTPFTAWIYIGKWQHFSFRKEKWAMTRSMKIH